MAPGLGNNGQPTSFWNKLLQDAAKEIVKALLVAAGTLLTTAVAQPTLWALLNPQPDQIRVALQNNNCSSLDFYVDGELKVRAISPNSSTLFKIKPGEYFINTCLAGTQSCSSFSQIVCTRPTTQAIARSSTCP